MNVGYIGLGRMGGGMARNLVKKVKPLYIFDQRAEAMAPLADEGATPCKSPAEVAAATNLIFMCVPFAPEVRAALFGPNGIAQAGNTGITVVDMTTLERVDAIAIAKEAKEKGIAYWDCPVSGTPTRADDGSLTIMFGGTADAFAAVEPLLRHMGEFIVHCGPVGAGQAMKSVNNVIYNVNIAAIAEVLPLTVAVGLDPLQVARVVTSGSSRSFASERFVPRMLDGMFGDDFAMGDAYKDIVNMKQFMADAKAKLPVVEAMIADYEATMKAGFDREPKSAMIKIFEKKLGVQFRKPGK